MQRVLLIGVAGFILSLVAVEWTHLDESGRFYAAVLETIRRVLLCGLITLGLGIVCLRDGEHREVDPRPAPWLAAGLFVGVLAFLLQSSIDIAFFQPGPFMLCLLVMGALLGIASMDRPARRGAFTLAALIATSLATLIILAAVVIPTGVAEAKANYARRLTPNQPLRAIALYEDAFRKAAVRNADYLLHAAEIAKAPGSGFTGDPRDLLARAIAADPTSIRARLARGRWLAEHVDNPADIAQAVEDFTESIRRNPNDIDLRIEFAGLLERIGKPRDAAAQLQTALEINDAYDPAEPERIELRSPAELERIRTTVARLQNQ